MPDITARTPIDRYGGEVDQEAQWMWWRGFRFGLLISTIAFMGFGLIAMAALL